MKENKTNKTDKYEAGLWQNGWYKNTGGRGIYFPYTRNGDCVNRALAIASDKNYKEVFEGLMEVATPLGLPINDDKVYTRYLKKNDYIWVYTPTNVNGRKPRPYDLEDWVNPGVWIIARQASHLVAVKNGYVHDIWNSSQRMVYGFWVKKSEEIFKKD